MLKLLPEPKRAVENRGYTTSFRNIGIGLEALPSPEKQEYLEIARMRFWNRKELGIVPEGGSEGCIEATIIPSLANIEADGGDLFLKQGYYLNVDRDAIVLKYQNKAGFINAITTLKQLLKKNGDGFALPLCEITDWPTVEHRAVAKGILTDKVRLDRRKIGLNASINFLVDFTDKETRAYLLENSQIFEIIDRTKIAKEVEVNPMPYSLSKFMYYLINAVGCLEQQKGAA